MMNWIALASALAGAFKILAGALSQWLEWRRRDKEAERDARATAYRRLSTALRARLQRRDVDTSSGGLPPGDAYRRD